ncbi:MAG: NTP transferase domain-containing protein [Myxococcales bacterium]|nr:NTP transferase domain-containing protein [Myxococcales bacterium]
MQPHPSTERLFPVVMAGGSGTRFWPLSRKARPKQLLSLLSAETMLAETLTRISPICPPERAVVITAERLVDAVRNAVPNVPPAQVIGEPMARNTAPCMALAAIVAAQLNPDAIIALLPADHHIGQPERFVSALSTACEQADAGHIVTLGVGPTRPETGYGYIELGEPVSDSETEVWAVDCFVEKPDVETAMDYLLGGRHLWNAGVFVVRADVAMAAIEQALPELFEALAPLHSGSAGRFDTDEFAAALTERFALCPSISIDYGVMEHRTDLRSVRLDAQWSDVGAWRSLLDHRAAGEDNFIRGDVLNMGSRDSVLVSDGPLLAAIGLQGVAVVATDDAVLALPVERSQDVRAIVSALRESGRTDLL